MIENWAIGKSGAKIIRPDTVDYNDRVTSCNITPILDLMNEQYKQYVDKIIQNDNQLLQPDQPAKQKLDYKTINPYKSRYKSPLIQCWVPVWVSLVALLLNISF